MTLEWAGGVVGDHHGEDGERTIMGAWSSTANWGCLKHRGKCFPSWREVTIFGDKIEVEQLIDCTFQVDCIRLKRICSTVKTEWDITALGMDAGRQLFGEEMHEIRRQQRSIYESGFITPLSYFAGWIFFRSPVPAPSSRHTAHFFMARS